MLSSCQAQRSSLHKSLQELDNCNILLLDTFMVFIMIIFGTHSGTPEKVRLRAGGQGVSPVTSDAIMHERVLTMTNRSNYDFTGWQSKTLGRQPTEAELGTAHALGRPGQQSLALAMAMRDCGMTASQMLQANSVCYGGKKGTPQNNHRKALIEAGLIERVQPFNHGGASLYKVALTDKGRAFVERRATEAATAKAEAKVKPAKVARKRKAKVDAPQAEVTPSEPARDSGPYIGGNPAGA